MADKCNDKCNESNDKSNDSPIAGPSGLQHNVPNPESSSEDSPMQDNLPEQPLFIWTRRTPRPAESSDSEDSDSGKPTVQPDGTNAGNRLEVRCAAADAYTQSLREEARAEEIAEKLAKLPVKVRSLNYSQLQAKYPHITFNFPGMIGPGNCRGQASRYPEPREPNSSDEDEDENGGAAV